MLLRQAPHKVVLLFSLQPLQSWYVVLPFYT